MNFIVSSSLLLKNLQSLSGVLGTNNPLPILDNFLFELRKNELIVSASDLETTMTCRMTVESQEAGKIAVPARILLDIVKSFAEQPLNFKTDTATFAIEISNDNGRYKLSGQDGEEFPKIPEMDGGKSFDVPSKVLNEAISKTVFATGTDDMRPVISGVLFKLGTDQVTFVATDAHKLVRYTRKDVKALADVTLIIPKKPLNLLKNALPTDDSEVNMSYNDSNVFFDLGSITMICRLIDGKYPNYEAVIPKENPNKLIIDRVAFLTAVKRAAIFANKTTHQVRLKIVGSELNVSAEDLDFANAASERLTCSYDGEDMEIGFNARFLVDMLTNLDGTDIRLEMSTPNRAGLLLPIDTGKGDEDLLMLVMPVMLNA